MSKQHRLFNHKPLQTQNATNKASLRCYKHIYRVDQNKTGNLPGETLNIETVLWEPIESSERANCIKLINNTFGGWKVVRGGGGETGHCKALLNRGTGN